MLSRFFKRKKPQTAEQQPVAFQPVAQQPAARETATEAPVTSLVFEDQKKTLVRKAWKPVTVGGEGPLAASRFSGRAWLEKDEGWPICQYCGKPMQLFLQLNLNEIPDAIRGEFGDGLVQLFFCTNSEAPCEVACDAWEPFAKSELVRLVHPSVSRTAIAVPDIEDYFPSKQIVGWAELEDYPLDEADDVGMGWSDEARERILEEGYPRPGDKLAGWPYWVQNVEYPNCPVCNTQMRLVFQIDSEDNLPHMFGDSGCGHITQCPAHKEQLAFAWACC
jgi:uncharacterized protein YwqG